MFSKQDNNEKYKPISVIITVLVSQIAKENAGKYQNTAQLLDIFFKHIDKYTQLLSEGVDSDFLRFSANERLIEKVYNNGKAGWRITNPADPEENLADRWAEDNNARANAFFQWINILFQKKTKYALYTV